MYRLRTQYPDPKYQVTFSTTCRIHHSSRRHIVSIIPTHLSLLRPFCPQTRHPHLAPSFRALDARKPTPKYWRVTHTDGHFGDLSEHHVYRSRTSAQQLSLVERVRSLCEARVRTFRCAGYRAPIRRGNSVVSVCLRSEEFILFLFHLLCVYPFTRSVKHTGNTRLLSVAPQDRGRTTFRPACGELHWPVCQLRFTTANRNAQQRTTPGRDAGTAGHHDSSRLLCRRARQEC